MTSPSVSSQTLIWLMRHGAIAACGEKRFVGQIDPPLGPDGRKQSQRLAQHLMHVPFSQVWSSDLKRAQETAALVCGNRNLTITSARQLREIHLGQWDGLAMSQIRERYPDLWQARGQDMGHFRPPEAESFSDLQLRAVPFIRQIAAQATGHTLIVTHAGVIRVLLCQVLQIPLSHLFRIHLDPGGLTFIKDIPGKSQVLAVNYAPDLLTIDDFI